MQCSNDRNNDNTITYLLITYSYIHEAVMTISQSAFNLIAVVRPPSFLYRHGFLTSLSNLSKAFRTSTRLTGIREIQ